jgi:hypothetical protein
MLHQVRTRFCYNFFLFFLPGGGGDIFRCCFFTLADKLSTIKQGWTRNFKNFAPQKQNALVNQERNAQNTNVL